VSHVEPAFVESQVQVMDEALRPVVAECTRSRGAPTTGEERNVAEVVATARNDQVVLGL
jgi:hypothetical protein